MAISDRSYETSPIAALIRINDRRHWRQELRAGDDFGESAGVEDAGDALVEHDDAVTLELGAGPADALEREIEVVGHIRTAHRNADHLRIGREAEGAAQRVDEHDDAARCILAGDDDRL